MSYQQLAEQLSIPLCAACDSLSRGAHQRGVVLNGQLHWQVDRKITRPSLRSFLMLAYTMLYEDRGAPLWHRVWHRNRFASAYALRYLHLRLPSRLFQYDRRLVAYLLQRPALGSVTMEHDAQRARRWTLRKGTR